VHGRARIRRGGEERELEVKVGAVEVVTYRIVDSGSPTPDQLKIREGWLQR
jgi:hypothetical protein